MRVVEIVTVCEHGEWVGPHCTMEREGRCPYYPTDTDRECYCPGGSRRVLEPGEFVLVEKAEDGEWKDEDAETLLKWATQRLMRYESRSGGRYGQLADRAEDLDFMMGALDALAEREQ